MIGIREDWFPTSVWFFDHPEPISFNADLLDLVANERSVDPSGLSDRSSVRGWHSRDDLHTRLPMHAFLAFLRQCLSEVIAFQQWDTAMVEPILDACWAIVNGPGCSNVLHNHPNSILSGAYYLQAPTDCGRIFFLDPRPAAHVILPPIARFTPWTFRRVHYDARPGRLLLFPSWLWHGVDPNESAEDRICLSFNVGLRWLERAKTS